MYFISLYYQLPWKIKSKMIKNAPRRTYLQIFFWATNNLFAMFQFKSFTAHNPIFFLFVITIDFSFQHERRLTRVIKILFWWKVCNKNIKYAFFKSNHNTFSCCISTMTFFSIQCALFAILKKTVYKKLPQWLVEN